MARIVLDITRLLSRVGNEVGTGVDRVEMAHALRLLDSDKHETTFAAIISGRARALDRRLVEPIVRTLSLRWGYRGSSPGQALTARFLGVEPKQIAGETKAAEPLRGLARRMSLRTMVAALRAKALANGQHGLMRLADQRVVYLHLSHLRLDHRLPFARLARRFNFRLVIFVHDLIPLSFPEYSRPHEAERHARRLSTAVELAESFIVNSADTRDSLMDYAESHGMTPPPITVAPLGIDFAARPPRLRKDFPPYFVTVGTIEPRKNHLLLLHLWRKLAAETGRPPKLLVIGRRGWENENVVDILERSHSVRSHVLETNDLPDGTLGEVIAGARALLFPSFVEGYGLPLVEALTLGTPVVASDLPVFREVGQGVPEFIDPLDGMAWYETILDYAQHNSLRRKAQLKRLETFRPPGWDAHFAAVDTVLTD